ncbi:hypothetical protein N9159_00085 [bacterium]|nr:hypothetical protein [bacterium]
MKGTTIVNDFKDLKKAIEEVTKSKPADTQYERQAKKMGYTQDESIGVSNLQEDEMSRAKEVIALQKKHDNEKDTEKDKLEKEKEQAKSSAERAKQTESVVTEANLMPSIQKIVDTKGAAKVGGVMLDMFTASVLTQAYAKVSDANKKKMETSNITTLVKLAQKVMGLKASNEFGKDPLKGFPYNEVKESIMNEITMGDMLIDIQQGATAKEISKTYKMPLSTAKDFLKSYYGQKKTKRTEGFASDAQRRAAFANGYKEKGKKKKEESVNEKFKSYTIKGSERITDFEIQFRGDEKQSEKDWNQAKKIVSAYSKTHKLNIKDARGAPLYSDPREGSSAFKVGVFASWNTNNKNHDLRPLVDQLAKLKTAEDHGGGYAKPIKEETISEGTWAVPNSRAQLKELEKYISKPAKFTNPKQISKWTDGIYNLFGDDGFFDDLGRLETLAGGEKEKKRNPELYARSEKNAEEKNQKVGMDLRDILVSRISEWGVKIKNYKITHAPQNWLRGETESVKEKLKRGKGNIKKPMGKIVKLESLKESFVTESPFKLKSKQYPRALAIETQGYGKRHAGEQDILEACDSFGMITEQELQIQQVEKTLGKKGFLTYNKTELADIFEDRETQRMILALESVTEVQLPTEYDRATITRALDEDTDVEFTKPDGMKAQGPVLKMSSNTYNLKDMHTGKSFTFKYIDEDKGVKTFGQVISEARFSSKLVKQAGGIAFDKRYVGGDMSGAIKAIEKLKKGLSDDPKVREILKYANESFNNKWYNAMSEDEKTDYQKFFSSALKKFGVNSPADLDNDKKKEFFNYVDKNYKAVDEQQFDEKAGKYSMYSDLLLQKQRFVAKGELKTPVLDKAIEKEKKKLGIKDSVNKVDGRIRPFKEKMTKLGYFKR